MEAVAYGLSTTTAGQGQVGVWAGTNTDNEFDDFQVIDIAGPYTVDAKYFSQQGGVVVDESDDNVLTMPGSGIVENCVVRRGVRVDKYVATYRFKWTTNSAPGFVVRWLSPREWLVVDLDTDGQAWLGYLTPDRAASYWPLGSASSVNLTVGNWYTGKVVVDDDPNNAALQRLRFWVDTDDDGSFADETTLLSDTAYIDAEWSAGYVGLYNWWWDAVAQEFDDVKVGFDNNSDGDFLDAGDAIQANDDFSSNAVNLVYDDNGNLTRDGVFNYVYDGWNRLRKVQRYDADDPNDATTIAEYEYDGKNRRTQKVVTNSGDEAYPNDGGDTTVHFYYDKRWRILEERDGSDQVLRQNVWGTRYTDELICIDVNGDPAEGDDCNPDVADPNDAELDARYFVHQDRNWNVVALTAYSPDPNDPNWPTNGAVVERYSQTPYGSFTVLEGASDDTEREGNARLSSLVGNAFVHQGLHFDAEKGSYQNRWREYATELERFASADPLGYVDGLNRYLYLRAIPVTARDPLGRNTWKCSTCGARATLKGKVERDCASGDLGSTRCNRLFPWVRCKIVCDDNIAAQFPNAIGPVTACVNEHEQDHYDGWCSSEESAYTAEGHCIDEHIDDCTSCACYNDLINYIEDGYDHCGSNACKIGWCNALLGISVTFDGCPNERYRAEQSYLANCGFME